MSNRSHQHLHETGVNDHISQDMDIIRPNNTKLTAAGIHVPASRSLPENLAAIVIISICIGIHRTEQATSHSHTGMLWMKIRFMMERLYTGKVRSLHPT